MSFSVDGVHLYVYHGFAHIHLLQGPLRAHLVARCFEVLMVGWTGLVVHGAWCMVRGEGCMVQDAW